MPEAKAPAYLPEDLLMQMLEKAPRTAKELADNVACTDQQIAGARDALRQDIKTCSDGAVTESIMAADGANIVDHKTGSDIILAIAVGVDGLSKTPAAPWPAGAKQYQQWQKALPHHVANPRLSQGVMFLMELDILSGSDRDIRIMDGTHLTTILKLNSLLSARDQDAADKPYVSALSEFLHESYEKIIPDLPDMVGKAFSCDSIIGMAKYSSSREIIDSQLKTLGIPADDKTLFTKVLRENEYTKPLPVGQSPKDRAMWRQVHIACNLDLGKDVDNADLNRRFTEVLKPFKPTADRASDMHFCYYKPYPYTPACRLEVKKSLAQDEGRMEMFLRSIKEQIVSFEIREPYPQYLADVIAKNISFGLEAVDEAIFSDTTLKNFDIIFPHRTR